MEKTDNEREGSGKYAAEVGRWETGVCGREDAQLTALDESLNGVQ